MLPARGSCKRCQSIRGLMSPAGSASKGLYRVHQFSKVEMFVLCTPQQSEVLLQELCDLEEEIFADLGLHFKILVSSLRMVHVQQWTAHLFSHML